jgi:ankyrin repeat protein
MGKIFELINLNMIKSIKEIVHKNQNVLRERDIDGNTPFIYSDFLKKWDIAEYFLRKKVNDVNASNNKHETALMYAARYGNLKCVQELHLSGADLNKSSLYVGPAIFYAFENLKKDILRYLVVNGADINLKNKYGISLLVKTIEASEINMISWLVDNGAEEIDNALRTAVMFNNFEAVEKLEEIGADINQVNNMGDSLIVEAINNKAWEIVELLFNKGAKIISNKSVYGWEILSSAVQAGKLELAKNIIELTKV